MQCSWSEDKTPTLHIPRQCGRDVAVIYMGPRFWQNDPICEEHVKAYEGPRNHDGNPWSQDKNTWKKLTPAEYEVHRVMSE